MVMISERNAASQAVSVERPIAHDGFRVAGFSSTSLFTAAYVLILLIYGFVMLHSPWVLRPDAAHDDGLYASWAESLLKGDWLGIYNDRTLAKPPGFAFFIASASLSGIPFNIAIASFNASATGFLSWALWRLTGSRIGALVTFFFVLLSPQYFMLGRLLREDIYCYQVIAYVAISIAWLCSRRSIGWAIFGGLTFGWIWITREDGIWLIPGTLLCLMLDRHRTIVKARDALCFLLVALITPLSVGFINREHYGRWAIAEINDPVFVKAMSATQSVSDGGRIPGVAVTKAARQMLYGVSPTFATLKPVLESPAFFDFACSYGAARCGQIGNGWWHWAVRDAARQLGFHQSPAKAAVFYKQVRADIEAACSKGVLHCDWRPIPALPTMSWSDVAQMPGYTLQILRTTTLVDPTFVVVGDSHGNDALLGPMFSLLNQPPTFQSVDLHSTLLKDKDAYMRSPSFAFLGAALQTYRFIFMALELSVLGLFIWRLFKHRGVGLGLLQRIILVVVVHALSRTFLLSIVGVTSFTTNNAMYIGPVYHLVALMFVLIGVASLSGSRFVKS